MSKLLRLLVALLSVVSLFALAACGDDDDDAAPTTEDTAADDGATDEGDEADGDEGGPPDENPCAEGASGDLGEEGPAPADDATPVSVTATEYQYAGGDELGEQGEYALTLTNDGQELHEAVVLRLAEGEVRPLDELLALEEGPETTDVAFAFACPGATADPVAVTIDEPGRYVMICFIPVGTFPTTPPEEFETLGPPHAAQGMVKEFTVS